jgi:hypothetical protein
MVVMCLFFSRSTITLAAISSIGQVNAYIFFSSIAALLALF